LDPLHERDASVLGDDLKLAGHGPCDVGHQNPLLHGRCHPFAAEKRNDNQLSGIENEETKNARCSNNAISLSKARRKKERKKNDAYHPSCGFLGENTGYAALRLDGGSSALRLDVIIAQNPSGFVDSTAPEQRKNVRLESRREKAASPRSGFRPGSVEIDDIALENVEPSMETSRT
jgi:hypothetical protein